MTQGGTAFNYGTTPFGLRSLGLGSLTPNECEMYGSNPPPGCPGNNSGSGSTGNKFDWNKAADAGNKLLDIFTGRTTTNPYPTPTPEKNNTGKVVLIGLGVLVAAGITYAIVRSTKKKKSK